MELVGKIRPRLRIPLAAGALVGVLIIGVFATGGFLVGRELQRNATFCAGCHVQTSQEWHASGADESHHTCIECHSEAGVVGTLRAEIEAFPNIAAYFFAGADPHAARADVPRSFCTQCHDCKEELLEQHHSTIRPRASVSDCLECHVTERQFADGPSVSSSAMIPACSACHDHSGKAPFRGTPAESVSLQVSR